MVVALHWTDLRRLTTPPARLNELPVRRSQRRSSGAWSPAGGALSHAPAGELRVTYTSAGRARPGELMVLLRYMFAILPTLHHPCFFVSVLDAKGGSSR